jgi:4-hydroxybutyrate dehydrogenase
MSLITYLTRIHFADRVLQDALAEEMALMGATRPLVIIDASGDNPELVERLLDALPKSSATAPVRRVATPAGAADAQRLTLLYRDQDCDSVIGFGGGAALDLARLSGLAGGDAGRLGHLLGGGDLRMRRMTLRCPVFAIPTVTENGLGLCPTLRLEGEGGARIVLAGGGAVPSVVLCDPRLTLAAPPRVTAAAGMDALALCVEAYLGTAFNPPADGIALEGVRRAGRSLDRAIRDGADLDARREALAAALNGGLAAQKGLGGAHALTHALAAAMRTSPGALQAAVLPRVLAFNLPAVRDRLPPLAAALDATPGAGFSASLTKLIRRLSLPLCLDLPALDTEERAAVARTAEEDPANRTNPRLATASDYLDMLDAALAADPAE